MEPLISVIIPTFNSEKYLRQCLDSVIGQTYRNLQIICVDDDSSDGTWGTLQEFASSDSRISIYKKINEGVSAARNYALTMVEGEYILFVDSDDWIESGTAECAVRTAEENAADVVMWSYIRETGTESKKKHIFDADVTFEANVVREKLYRRMIGVYGNELSQPENADALCTVWGKLYRSEIVCGRDIRFYDIREIGTYEDGLFNLDVFSHVSKAVFIERYFYHYRRNNAASLTTVYKPKLPQQWNKLFALLENHICDHGLDAEFRQALSNRIALSLISLGINEMERDASAAEKIRSIRSILFQKKYREALATLQMQFLPIHWNVFFKFARIKWATGVYGLLLIIQRIRGR